MAVETAQAIIPIRWKMQPLLDRGVSGRALRAAEEQYIRTVETTVANAEEPPLTYPPILGSRRVGFGYAMNVVKIPGQDLVAKVPRGVFPEVNDPETLENAKSAYARCKKHIGNFTHDTHFIRMEGMGFEDTTILFQRQTPPHEELLVLDPKTEAPEIKMEFYHFGTGLLAMLDEFQ